MRELGRRLADPAGWRDVGWLILDACGGRWWSPACRLIATGLAGCLRVLTQPRGGPAFLGHSPLMVVVVSSGLIVLGLGVAPRC